MAKYLISGGAAYVAAKFVFDASQTKSLIAAGIAVAALYASLNLLPSTK